MNLKLHKPLCIFDLETTGINISKDKIIEICILKVFPDASRESKTWYVNPEMPIPAEATRVNNITDEMVKTQPKFKEIAEGVSKFLEGCDLIGFSIENFDLKFLGEEFNKAGVEFGMMGRKIIDISKIYHAMEPRDLASAYSFYCDKKMPEKSGSENITNTYFEIVNNMFEKYKGKEYVDKEEKSHVIEPTVESIHKIFNKNVTRFDINGNIVANEQGRPVFNFGKHKGSIVSELMLSNTDYYEWFMEVSEFPLDTKAIVKRIVERAKSASLAK